MTTAAVAVISPSALRDNLDRVRELAPGCRVLAVVKANAYGHGLVRVARILQAADALAVARLEEAAELRDAGIGGRIVLLGGCARPVELEAAAALGLDVVIHHPLHVEMLAALRPAQGMHCWLKIDTGMGRLGMEPQDVPGVCDRLKKMPGVAGVTLMTHFACADDGRDPATGRQLDRFFAAIGAWQGDISLANSAAILQWPHALQAAGRGSNWVRPGLMLYGASPLADKSATELGLRAAMSFETRLIAIKRIPQGRRIGYGGTCTARRDTTIGIAAAGYADGYPWRVTPGLQVRINGRDAPLAGRVSMDMITIDLDDVANARIGDRVVLWGPDGPAVETVAAAAGTIPWALLTGIGRRVAMHTAGEGGV